MTPTATQIENVRVAYAVMAGVPSEKIELSAVRDTMGFGAFYVEDDALLHECKTTACIAGWLSSHPYFKAQGFTYGDSTSGLAKHGRMYFYKHMASDLTGDSQLFNAVNEDDVVGTQKQVALARLRRYLRQNNAITIERGQELADYERTLA